MAVRFTPAVTPTITGGAYSQNDCVGGVITIEKVGQDGTIMSVVMADDGDQGSSFEFWFFRSAPVGVADNEVFSLSDADIGLCVGVLALDTWFDAVTGQVLAVDNIAMPFATDNGDLFLMMKVDDASAPTYVATDDLHISFGIVY